jgi:hypothetical protein
VAPARPALVAMTKPLRRAHLAIWVVLPVLLLTILLISLMVRRPTTPTNPTFHWESLP